MSENNEPKLAKCPNCQKQLDQTKLDLHISYCQKNFKTCQICSRLYDINYQLQHEDEYHKTQRCEECDEFFNCAQYKQHKKSCGPKYLICVSCDQNVPQSLYQHHKKVCESRTMPCQICGKHVNIKQFEKHQVSCMDRLSNPEKYISLGQMLGHGRQWGHKKLKTQQNKPKSVAVALYNNPTTKQKPNKRQSSSSTLPSFNRQKLLQERRQKLKQKNSQNKKQKEKVEESAGRKRTKIQKTEVIDLDDDQSVKQIKQKNVEKPIDNSASQSKKKKQGPKQQ